MLVTSKQMEGAAAEIRRRKRGPQVIPAEDVTVSAAQCDTAARLLREADPCVIRSPKRYAGTNERPGFIEHEAQTDSEILVLQIGIIPSTTYHIDRQGEVVSQS